jgi:hypothetical protein
LCFRVASSTRCSRAVPRTRGSRESTARARCVRAVIVALPLSRSSALPLSRSPALPLSRSPALPLSRSSLAGQCKSASSTAVTQKYAQCHYRGTLISGVEFDSSYKRGQPTTFAPNQVVRGWTEAMQLMREGDKWQVRITWWLCEEWGWAGGRGWAVRGGRERDCVCRWSGSVWSDVPALACVRVRAGVRRVYCCEQLFLPSELAYGQSQRGQHITPGDFRFRLGVVLRFVSTKN